MLGPYRLLAQSVPCTRCATRRASICETVYAGLVLAYLMISCFPFFDLRPGDALRELYGEFFSAWACGLIGVPVDGRLSSLAGVGQDARGIWCIRQEKSRLMRDQAAFQLVPRRGLEPPRSYPLVPETSASTNFATWAGTHDAVGAKATKAFAKPFASIFQLLAFKSPLLPAVVANKSAVVNNEE